MALTYTQRAVDTPGYTPRIAVTSITLDTSYVSGSGGIAVDPGALGGFSKVFWGVITVRQEVATQSPSNGILDCTNPAAPLMKLQAAGDLGELPSGAGSGAVVDVLCAGY